MPVISLPRRGYLSAAVPAMAIALLLVPPLRGESAPVVTTETHASVAVGATSRSVRTVVLSLDTLQGNSSVSCLTSADKVSSDWLDVAPGQFERLYDDFGCEHAP